MICSLHSVFTRTGDAVIPPGIRKAAFLLSGSAAIGHLCGLLAIPLVARLYTPADFGVFAVCLSILTTLLIVSSLRFNNAIPIQESDRETRSLVVFCLIACLIMTVVTGIVALTLIPILLPGLGDGLTNLYATIIAAGFLLSGISMVLAHWNIRERNYEQNAKSTLASGIVGPVVKICAGVASMTAGLFVGDFFSRAGELLVQCSGFRGRLRQELSGLSPEEVWRAARRNMHFALFSAPASLLSTFAQQVPVIVIVYAYGPSDAGLYAMAYALVSIPLSVVIPTVAQLFLGEVAPLIRTKPQEIRRFYLGALKKMAVFTIPLMAVLAVAAPFLFPLYLGHSWEGAGLLCLPLAVVIAVQMIFAISILNLTGFNRWALGLEIFRMVAVLGALISGPVLGLDLGEVLFLYSVVITISCLGGYMLNLKAIDYIEYELPALR